MNDVALEDKLIAEGKTDYGPWWSDALVVHAGEIDVVRVLGTLHFAVRYNVLDKIVGRMGTRRCLIDDLVYPDDVDDEAEDYRAFLASVPPDSVERLVELRPVLELWRRRESAPAKEHWAGLRARRLERRQRRGAK